MRLATRTVKPGVAEETQELADEPRCSFSHSFRVVWAQSAANTEYVVPDFPSVPEQLIDRYVRMALRRAVVERTEDGKCFATILVLPDVWAEGATPAKAISELAEVTRQWVVMKIEEHDRDLPVLESLDLNRF